MKPTTSELLDKAHTTIHGETFWIFTTDELAAYLVAELSNALYPTKP